MPSYANINSRLTFPQHWVSHKDTSSRLPIWEGNVKESDTKGWLSNWISFKWHWYQNQTRRSPVQAEGANLLRSLFTSSGKQMLPQHSHACLKLSQRKTFICIHILVPLCLTKQHGVLLEVGINHWRYIRRVCMCIYVRNPYINMLSVVFFSQDPSVNFRPEGRWMPRWSDSPRHAI